MLMNVNSTCVIWLSKFSVDFLSDLVYCDFSTVLSCLASFYEIVCILWIVNTRNKSSLHQPPSKLSVYQRGAYCTGIRVFNSLPPQIKEVSHKRQQFKRILKEFLYTHSFCTLDQYFNCKTTNDI